MKGLFGFVRASVDKAFTPEQQTSFAKLQTLKTHREMVPIHHREPEAVNRNSAIYRANVDVRKAFGGPAVAKKGPQPKAIAAVVKAQAKPAAPPVKPLPANQTRQQLLARLGYAGNTPEQVKQIHKAIDALDARAKAEKAKAEKEKIKAAQAKQKPSLKKASEIDGATLRAIDSARDLPPVYMEAANWAKFRQERQRRLALIVSSISSLEGWQRSNKAKFEPTVGQEVGRALAKLKTQREQLVTHDQQPPPEPKVKLTEKMEKGDSFAEALKVASAKAHAYGDHKAYLSSVYNNMPSNLRGPSLEGFKQRLISMHRKGEIELARADLVTLMDPDLVASSRATYHTTGTDFHFLVRGSVKSQAGEAVAEKKELAQHEFDKIVQRHVNAAPEHHGLDEKVLINKVWEAARSELDNISLVDFKNRLRTNRHLSSVILARADIPQLMEEQHGGLGRQHIRDSEIEDERGAVHYFLRTREPPPKDEIDERRMSESRKIRSLVASRKR